MELLCALILFVVIAALIIISVWLALDIVCMLFGVAVCAIVGITKLIKWGWQL